VAYAKKTNVAVSKTKGEIDGLLRKYGATGFGSFEERTRALLVFEMKDRRIRFVLPLPDRQGKQFTVDGRGRSRSLEARLASWEQACRSKWRALFLCIKAKLESVEAGIETFEDSFLAHIQLPDGMTVGEHVKPNIAIAYGKKAMQPLLPEPQ
jgi:hypothetical protein